MSQKRGDSAADRDIRRAAKTARDMHELNAQMAEAIGARLAELVGARYGTPLPAVLVVVAERVTE